LNDVNAGPQQSTNDVYISLTEGNHAEGSNGYGGRYSEYDENIY